MRDITSILWTQECFECSFVQSERSKRHFFLAFFANPAADFPKNLLSVCAGPVDNETLFNFGFDLYLCSGHVKVMGVNPQFREHPFIVSLLFIDVFNLFKYILTALQKPHQLDSFLRGIRLLHVMRNWSQPLWNAELRVVRSLSLVARGFCYSSVLRALKLFDFLWVEYYEWLLLLW